MQEGKQQHQKQKSLNMRVVEGDDSPDSPQNSGIGVGGGNNYLKADEMLQATNSGDETEEDELATINDDIMLLVRKRRENTMG